MQKEIHKLSSFPFQRVLFIRNWKSNESGRRTDGLFHFHGKIYDDLITLNLISVGKISQRGGEREEESKVGRGRNQSLGSAWLYC